VQACFAPFRAGNPAGHWGLRHLPSTLQKQGKVGPGRLLRRAIDSLPGPSRRSFPRPALWRKHCRIFGNLGGRGDTTENCWPNFRAADGPGGAWAPWGTLKQNLRTSPFSRAGRPAPTRAHRLTPGAPMQRGVWGPTSVCTAVRRKSKFGVETRFAGVMEVSLWGG